MMETTTITVGQAYFMSNDKLVVALNTSADELAGGQFQARYLKGGVPFGKTLRLKISEIATAGHKFFNVYGAVPRETHLSEGDQIQA